MHTFFPCFFKSGSKLRHYGQSITSCKHSSSRISLYLTKEGSIKFSEIHDILLRDASGYHGYIAFKNVLKYNTVSFITI